jgi:CheY-like chemotaxis protein
MRRRKLPREHLDEALSEARKTGDHLGVILVRKGRLSREEVEAALQEQIAEEIYDLFTWTTASFEYTGTYGAAAAGGREDLSIDADVTSVMLEASRLADELSQIQKLIPDVQMVPRRAAEIPVLPDPQQPEARALQVVLPLIDGKRSVGRLIDESGLPRFKVLETLHRLIQRGALEIEDARGDTTVRRRTGMTMVRSAQREKRVLILSEGGTSRALAAAVRTAGFAAEEAESSAGIRETIQKHDPKAILLDVGLETEQGLAHCARLKSVTSVPFIALAGQTSPQAVENAFRSGARYVLVKPVNDSLLVERLSELLTK